MWGNRQHHVRIHGLDRFNRLVTQQLRAGGCQPAAGFSLHPQAGHFQRPLIHAEPNNRLKRKLIATAMDAAQVGVEIRADRSATSAA